MLPQFRNAYSKPVVLREWTSSHGPVASGLPDTKVYQLLANLLEMHILRPHPTLTELETLEVGPGTDVCAGYSDVLYSLKNTHLDFIL